MRHADSVSERYGEFEKRGEFHPVLRYQRVERPPFDELHRQEGNAVGFFNRVDRDDVGMVERGNRLRLALKAAEPLGVGRRHQRQDFQGDDPIEPGVLGRINLAHATAPERPDDPVVVQGRADHEEPDRAILTRRAQPVDLYSVRPHAV